MCVCAREHVPAMCVRVGFRKDREIDRLRQELIDICVSNEGKQRPLSPSVYPDDIAPVRSEGHHLDGRFDTFVTSPSLDPGDEISS